MNSLCFILDPNLENRNNKLSCVKLRLEGFLSIGSLFYNILTKELAVIGIDGKW